MNTAETEIRAYLEILSSKEAVPGGGGASALAGSLGSALGLMVGNLTVGKKKYAAAEPEIRRVMEELVMLRESFLKLADRDAEVFAPLARAYGLPKGTEAERAEKDRIMEACLGDAAEVPLQILRTAAQVIPLLEILEEKGSIMAVSDVGVAVSLIRAAMTGAAMNIYINTGSMRDRKKAAAIDQETGQLLDVGRRDADALYERVLARLHS